MLFKETRGKIATLKANWRWFSRHRGDALAERIVAVEDMMRARLRRGFPDDIATLRRELGDRIDSRAAEVEHTQKSILTTLYGVERIAREARDEMEAWKNNPAALFAALDAMKREVQQWRQENRTLAEQLRRETNAATDQVRREAWLLSDQLRKEMRDLVANANAAARQAIDRRLVEMEGETRVTSVALANSQRLSTAIAKALES